MRCILLLLLAAVSLASFVTNPLYSQTTPSSPAEPVSQQPSQAKPAAAGNSEDVNSRRQQALKRVTETGSILLGLVGILGAFVIAVCLIWGARMRRMARRPPAGSANIDPWWYLRKDDNSAASSSSNSLPRHEEATPKARR